MGQLERKHVSIFLISYSTFNLSNLEDHLIMMKDDNCHQTQRDAILRGALVIGVLLVRCVFLVKALAVSGAFVNMALPARGAFVISTLPPRDVFMIRALSLKDVFIMFTYINYAQSRVQEGGLHPASQ